MDAETFSDGLLGWIIRIAGLVWLVGAIALFRQIRMEMALDRMTSTLEDMARDFETPATTSEKNAVERWQERDDAARRGWIAAQAVVLAVTAVAMMILHPVAAWMAALLVLGQGFYFIWREWTARRAPDAETAAHARPSRATVNAGWVSLVVAMLVWTASFRGVLQ